ncbi:MAG: hypothetical protein ACRCTQ_03000, partial [Brevinemataceae bacterium]
CAVKPVYQKNTYVVDYSVYNKQGVFLTESPSVSFPYDPVGSVLVTIKDGNVAIHNDKTYQIQEQEGVEYVGKKEYKIATTGDALQELTDLTKKLGADAVVGLKLEYKIESSKDYARGVVIVSGMAVKRK